MMKRTSDCCCLHQWCSLMHRRSLCLQSIHMRLMG